MGCFIVLCELQILQYHAYDDVYQSINQFFYVTWNFGMILLNYYSLCVTSAYIEAVKDFFCIQCMQVLSVIGKLYLCVRIF